MDGYNQTIMRQKLDSRHPISRSCMEGLLIGDTGETATMHEQNLSLLL